MKLCDHAQLNSDRTIICDWNNRECPFYVLIITGDPSQNSACGGYDNDMKIGDENVTQKTKE